MGSVKKTNKQRRPTCTYGCLHIAELQELSKQQDMCFRKKQEKLSDVIKTVMVLNGGGEIQVECWEKSRKKW